MAGDADDGWGKTIHWLSEIPHGQANARLLALIQSNWSGRVIARTSMTDLLFTTPGDQHPFSKTVQVSWADGVFEFQLTVDRKLVTADRCFEPTAPAVLESFLVQLVGDP